MSVAGARGLPNALGLLVDPYFVFFAVNSYELFVRRADCHWSLRLLRCLAQSGGMLVKKIVQRFPQISRLGDARRDAQSLEAFDDFRAVVSHHLLLIALGLADHPPPLASTC